jgi:DNA-binding SARP family transcriptional activator
VPHRTLGPSPDACYNEKVLEFRLLGPLEVIRDGAPVDISGHRQRSLLALLLVRARQLVPTERLVDELWGEEAPRTATTSLQNAISQLRRVLGPQVLQTRTPGYVLDVEPESIDVHRFERLLRRARGEAADERAATLRAALDLWRGAPLAEFELEPFAQAEIRRLSELRLAALEDRIEADLELGLAAELIGELEGLIEQEPLRERPRGHLMLALYRSGRQAEALTAYQDARRVLTEELGIDPSTPLQQLHGAILRQEAGLEPGPHATAPAEVDDDVLKCLLAGRVVPVLGAGGAAELAEELAKAFDLDAEGVVDLARVSQRVATLRGPGPLYDRLHELFEAAVEPEPTHRFLARLPPLLRASGAPQLLIVTTHYDLALERAFEETGEEVDVVSYVASGPHRGKFWHRPPGAPPRPIDLPNEYATELSLERRTIILKLRGAVDLLPEREWESFVITEDDHIDYLGRGELSSAVPVSIAATLRRSHFLFLGYDLVDWNLRLILGRIWGARPLAYSSWAVQPKPNALERAFWRQREVDVLDVEPAGFVELLEQRLASAS